MQTSSLESQAGIFRREGDFWALAYRGEVSRLKDVKGLRYIVHLLRNPGIEFHALDLIAGTVVRAETSAASKSELLEARRLELDGSEQASPDVHVGGLGDAGEMLDAQARREYRHRLSELREELEEATQQGDSEAAEKAEDEINALVRELSRAVGLGGRERRAGSASERARLSVTRAIKSALDKVAENDAEMGEMLARTIKTGTFCVYQPGPRYAVNWEFGMPSAGIAAVSSPATVNQSLERKLPPESGGWADASSLTDWSFSERTIFVGRETERAQIASAAEEMLAGKGSVVMIAGGPGVGKSRLALECARDAAKKGALILRGRCIETEEPYPYLPFVEMLELALEQSTSRERFRVALGENATELAQLAPRLRQVYADIPPPLELPPQAARRYLFESVCEFLARSSRIQPIFLVLEDLHWADESTLSLFVHVSRRISSMRVVIAGTYRDTETELNQALNKALEQLVRGGLRPIRLKGLQPPAVEKMLESLCGREPPPPLVEAICQETDGNPFFIEELFEHLVEEGKIFDSSGQFYDDLRIDELDVPENVRLVIGRRLDRLGESTRQALSVAAVIGRSFSFKLLESLEKFDLDPLLEAIEEALRMGLIVSSSEGPESPFNFAHELVRQTLLARLSPPRRQRLHLLVAFGIERASASDLDSHASEIAHHLIQAGTDGDQEKLLRYLTVAGKRAMQAAAFEDALRYFEGALARSAAGDARARAEVRSQLGMAKRSLDRWEEALADWKDSLETYIALGDRNAAGQLSIAIVEALNWAARHLDGAQIAYQALSQLDDSAKSDRAWLLGVLSGIYASVGDYQRSQDANQEAVRLAEESGDRRVLGEVLSYRSFNHFTFACPEPAISDAQRAADLLRAENALWSLTQILAWLQTEAFAAGRLDLAEATAAELDPLANKLGYGAARMLSSRIHAWLEFRGHHKLAVLEKSFEQDLQATRAAKLPWVATCYARLSAVKFMRGDWSAALAYAEQACSAEVLSAFDGPGTGMLFRQRAYLGDRSGALELLERKRSRMPRLEAIPSRVGALGLALLVIEGFFVLGDRSEAGALYPCARKAVDAGMVFMPEIGRFPQTSAGIAAAAAEAWDLAEEHFELAARHAHQYQLQTELAEILRFHGQVLLERGRPADRERALTMLSQATERFQQFGMARHVKLSESLKNR